MSKLSLPLSLLLPLLAACNTLRPSPAIEYFNNPQYPIIIALTTSQGTFNHGHFQNS